jgi:lipopolysaccharide biosynthesis regulator YciM
VTEWLFLLLPLAAFSGWWVARRTQAGRRSGGAIPDAAFLRGLNYLLDQRPDKAIDLFVKLAEVDSDTVELHLALGSLFRRRGEVERAIRIHQNLVARPGLDRGQRGFALYELAQDYNRAGLFDRAEALLLELVEIEPGERRGLRGLLDIYQQEKDWARCLEIAQRLALISNRPMDVELSQYHCELAEEALRAPASGAVSGGAVERAREHLSAAQAAHPLCVRAMLLEGRLANERGDAVTALGLYRRVAEQGPAFISEVLPQLVEVLSAQRGDSLIAELERLYRIRPGSALALALADAVEQAQGPEAAAYRLARHLRDFADPIALERLLALVPTGSEPGVAPASSGPLGAHLETVRRVVRRLAEQHGAYQCDHCGFLARRLHWQCPSCKRWGTIKAAQPEPMQGDAGPGPPRTPTPGDRT